MKATKRRLEISEGVIRSHLPIPPFSHKYRITQQSPQIWRVDLIHPSVYSYTTERVWTVWGFIKGDKVYPPRNSQKPRRSPLCDLTEIPDDRQFTTITHDVTSLWHLG